MCEDYSCKTCGAKLNKKVKYCSKRCHNRRVRENGGNTCKGLFICEQCNVWFTTNRQNTEPHKYCSRICSDKALSNKHKTERDRKTIVVIEYRYLCEGCGKRLKTRIKSHIGPCSSVCRSLVYYKNIHKLKPAINCIVCGVLFTRLYGHPYLCCSDACVNQRTKEEKAKHKAKRRAAIYTDDYELINPIDIFKRDNWTCQGCGFYTPSRLRGSINDYAPELDHIVPLSKGGSHTWDNLQCLCRACNQIKSDKPMDYLKNLLYELIT